MNGSDSYAERRPRLQISDNTLMGTTHVNLSELFATFELDTDAILKDILHDLFVHCGERIRKFVVVRPDYLDRCACARNVREMALVEPRRVNENTALLLWLLRRFFLLGRVLISHSQ